LENLGVTHRVYLWLDGKRVVDFLLTIIAVLASSHGYGTIKRRERLVMKPEDIMKLVPFRQQ